MNIEAEDELFILLFNYFTNRPRSSIFLKYCTCALCRFLGYILQHIPHAACLAKLTPCWWMAERLKVGCRAFHDVFWPLLISTNSFCAMAIKLLARGSSCYCSNWIAEMWP